MSAHIGRPVARRQRRSLAIEITAAVLIAAAPAHAAPKPGVNPGATVEELLELVKKFNPTLAASALDTEAAIAKIVPAGSLDDPMVNVNRDQGFMQTTFGISQEFPFWGKLDLRQDVAAANAQAARGQQGDISLQLAERVKVAFAEYYEADRAIKDTKDIRTVLHALADTVRTRYGLGLVNQSDVIRADIEQTRLDTTLATLEQARESAKARINALIGRSADAQLVRPLVLRTVPPVASLGLHRLVARALDNNPMLAARRAEVRAAEGERQLVERSWYPDFTVSVGGDQLPNMPTEPMVGVGVKVPLQWGARDARAQAATAKKGAARLRLDADILNIQSELKSRLAMLQQAERTTNLLRTTLTPQSEAAYRSALASYGQGRGDLTSVLDAVHKQFEFQIEILRVATQAQTAMAAIERTVGGNP